MTRKEFDTAIAAIAALTRRVAVLEARLAQVPTLPTLAERVARLEARTQVSTAAGPKPECRLGTAGTIERRDIFGYRLAAGPM